MKKFMPELSDRDRLVILEQNADKIEETTYQKPLNEDELAQRKDVLTENSIRLGDLEEEKKEATKQFKDQIDPIRKINKELLIEIRTKQAKVNGRIFHLANHEEGVLETYDENGDFISSRRLRPEERQGRIPLTKVM